VRCPRSACAWWKSFPESPGGAEIPNEKREIVTLGEIIKSKPYDEVSSPLALALGKDIGGVPVVADLARMPHLLIAGTTGSGKSVGINAMVLSLVYKATPEHVRMIMIDPKMLELSCTRAFRIYCRPWSPT